MSDDVLVKVDNVSKRFCRSLKRSLWYGLQDLGSEIGGRRHGGGRGLPQSSADVQLRPDEFWAVKDVSFELRRGECLGLIGRNGAGKTTLLRILNGLIKPDTGSIEMRGRVAALIALGAGFNPVLTGRENIEINASLIGLSRREAKDKLDEIIDFAEINDFIDSPVQTYSSGMQVRLGFAVASSLSPDILILDEVLAVGDRQFQLKCFNKIGAMRENGCATILVSHYNHHLIRFCDRGIALAAGEGKYQGPIADSIKYHEESANANLAAPIRSGNSQIKIEILSAKDSKIIILATVSFPLSEISILGDHENIWAELVFRNSEGIPLLYAPTSISREYLVKTDSAITFTVTLSGPHLNNVTLVPSFALWNEKKTYSLATNSGEPVYISGDPENIGLILPQDVRVNSPGEAKSVSFGSQEQLRSH